MRSLRGLVVRVQRPGVWARVGAQVGSRARLRAPGHPRGAAAVAARRAAALLRGGVPTHRVWLVLSDEPDAPAELAQMIELLQGGASARQIDRVGLGEEWRVLLAAWRLSEQSGAPLAAVLERLAVALESLERLGERRSVLLAGPRATIRLVASLPLAALLLGWALGFDPFAVLVTPLGAALLVLGGLLLLIGVRWATRMTNRLADTDWVAGLECELTWVAISGGASPALALRRVADSVDLSGAHWVKLGALVSGASVRTVLAAAETLGTPAGAMLLAEGHAARARALAELEREAEKLAVRVLIPLGVCVLPSFIVLGVVPVLLAVMGGLG